MRRTGLFLAMALATAGCSDSSTPGEGDAGGGVDAGPGGGTDGGGGLDAGPTADAGPRPDAGPVVGVDAGPCDSWDPGITLGDPITATADEWTFIEFPDSRCMNDTPTGIGVNLNPASDNVMIFMEGGGACFDLVTCFGVAHSDGFNAGTMASIASSYGGQGIFDRDDPDNPVRDWNMVFIPYCTGDVHAGDQPDGYGGRSQTGYRNIGEYLERLVPTFAGATQVLLTGSSAGGFGAAYNFDRVQRAFGCTPVTLLDDSGPPMADEYMTPCLQQWWRDTWNIDATLPSDCAACAGPDGGGLVHFTEYLALKYPDRRFGLLSTTEDTTIRTFFGYGHTESCRSPTRMNAALFTEGLLDLRDRVLAPYDNFHTFYVTSDAHTFLGRPMGDVTVGGLTLGEWVRRLLEADSAWGTVGP